MAVEHVTRDFTSAWDALKKADLTQCVSFPLDHEHQVVTLIPSATAVNAFDQAMVWDWETGDTFIYKFSSEMNTAARFIDADKVFYLLGTYAGYVYKAGVGADDNSNTDPEDDGTAIPWVVQMSRKNKDSYKTSNDSKNAVVAGINQCLRYSRSGSVARAQRNYNYRIKSDMGCFRCKVG